MSNNRPRQLDLMQTSIAPGRRDTTFVHAKDFCTVDKHAAIRPYAPTSRSKIIPMIAAGEMGTSFKACVDSSAARSEYNQQISVLIQEELDLNSMFSQNNVFEVPDSEVDSTPFANFLNEK